MTSLQSLTTLCRRLVEAVEIDEVLREAAAGAAEHLGLPHSLWFVITDGADRLTLVESHGYDESGVGSEVVIGQGTIGVVAARGIPIRMASMSSSMTYGRAAQRTDNDDGPAREIPMPGLPAVEAQLAVPLIAVGRVIGVVCVESEVRGAFSRETEQALSLVAAVVASAIAHLSRESEGDDAVSSTSGETPEPRSESSSTKEAAPAGANVAVRHYQEDGSIFLDGEYLIKSLPGRILWRLLSQWKSESRVDFTTKELRLDASLQLPPVRDNLDTRLLLLRRRLEERTEAIGLHKSGRGRMRLDVSAPLTLEFMPEG